MVNCNVNVAFTTDTLSPTRAGIWTSYPHNPSRLRDVKLVLQRLPRRMTPVFYVLGLGRHTDQQAMRFLHSPPDLCGGTAGTALSIYECSRKYLILMQFQACIQMRILHRMFRPTRLCDLLCRNPSQSAPAAGPRGVDQHHPMTPLHQPSYL